MSKSNYERRQFLANVAELYYMEGCSQAEVARRFGYSRSAISKMLTEAHDSGLIEIRINHPLERAAVLENMLRSRFQLKNALVVQRGNSDYDHLLRLLGRQGAKYLSENLLPGSTLGISWGTTLHEVANAFRPRHIPDIKVVQMIGAVGNGDPKIDGPDLARKIAYDLGGQSFILNAPLVVENAETAQALLSQKAIRETLHFAANADFALIGIGSVRLERTSLIRSGHTTTAEMVRIMEQGAVGDVLARHYDANGRLLNLELSKRTIGIDIDTLINSDTIVIGIAGGRMKADAILGALRGHFIDVLITDTSAAEAILKLSNGRY